MRGDDEKMDQWQEKERVSIGEKNDNEHGSDDKRSNNNNKQQLMSSFTTKLSLWCN